MRHVLTRAWEEKDQTYGIRLLKARYQIALSLAIAPHKISLAIYGRNSFVKMYPRKCPGGSLELVER